MKSLEKVYTEGLKPMNFGQHDFDDDFDMYYRTQITIRDFKYLSGSLYGDAKMIKCEILPGKKELNDSFITFEEVVDFKADEKRLKTFFTNTSCIKIQFRIERNFKF